jgi:hypothetical protein
MFVVIHWVTRVLVTFGGCLLVCRNTLGGTASFIMCHWVGAYFFVVIHWVTRRASFII